MKERKESYMFEANLSSLFSKASSAHHKSVFSNKSHMSGADSALSGVFSKSSLMRSLLFLEHDSKMESINNNNQRV